MSMCKKLETPSPADVRSMRGERTQAQCAELVHVGARTWRKWEGGERKMPAATWELFLIKTGKLIVWADKR